MSFAKPTSSKYPATSKCGTRLEAFLRDRSAVRFLLANIGGAAILALVTALRSSEDDDFSYEVALLFVGVAAYFYSHGQRQKRKVKTPPKCSRDDRPSAREKSGVRERQAAPLESRRQPRQTPTFSTVGWEAEIVEFLTRVSPTNSNDAVLLALTEAVKEGIKPIVPEANVAAFASVNLVSNRDVGSLEADVTIELEQGLLAKRMESFGLRKVSQRPKNDKQVADRKSPIGMTPDDLAKYTLRMLTRELAQGGYFLYHHCAYKEREPKVVLRVPQHRGVTDRDIFVTFTVNCPTPARTATLGQQLELFDHTALELGLLVRRWSRDRGIAYATKGHLSPYAWTCLVAFYLQRRCGDATEKPTFGLDCQQDVREDKASEVCGDVGAMFKDFLRFYVNFDWSAGVISLRLGRQASSADSSLEHSLANGRMLGIEDPFEPTRNAAETITPEGFRRLIDELTRARTVLRMDCNSDDGRDCASFTQLLEPWIAPKDTL